MNRLIYENSVSHRGHPIVPFVFGMADGYSIYSYKLLSDLGHKGKFHKSENPAGIYSGSIASLIEIAKEHLDRHTDVLSQVDDFKSRYTYRHNLIIIYQQCGKYFYDRYPPDSLRNIAAPKLFLSEQECINWIEQGLDRQQATSTIIGNQHVRTSLLHKIR